MPDGFSSIDDLKVAVTASTEKLQGGLDDAMGIIQKFSTQGTAQMGQFDGSLAKVGNMAMLAKGHIGAFLLAAETGFAALKAGMDKLEGWAKVAGLEKEFGELKSSFLGIGDSIALGFGSALAVGATNSKTMALGLVGLSADADITSVAIEKTTSLVTSLTMAGKSATEKLEPMAAAAETAAPAVAALAASASAAVAPIKVVSEATDQSADASLRAASMARMAGYGLAEVTAAAPKAVDALKSYSSEAAKLDGKRVDNPFKVEEPNGIMGRITAAIQDASAMAETFVDVASKSDAALAGAVGTLNNQFGDLRARLEDTRQGRGTFSQWLFGQDESYIQNRLKSIGDKIEELKSEIAKRGDGVVGADVQKEIDAIEKQTKALDQKYRTIGMAVGDVERLVAQEAALAKLGKEMTELSGASQKALNVALDARKAQAELTEKGQNTHAVTKAIDDLAREAAAIEHKTQLLGKDADEVARLTAEYKIKTMAEQKATAVTDEMTAAVTKHSEAIGTNTLAMKAREAVLATSKAIDGIEEQTRAIEFQIRTYGMAAHVVAALAAEEKILNDARKAGIELTDEELDRMQDAGIRRRDAGDTKDGMDKSKSIRDTIAGITDQNAALGRQIEASDATAGALAALAVQEKVLGAARKAGRDLTNAEIDAMVDEMIVAEELATKKDDIARGKAFDRDIDGAEKEAQAMQRKVQTMFMEAGAAAELIMQEKLLAAAKRHNQDIDAAKMSEINRIARALGDATREAKQLEAALGLIKSSGQLASNALVSAFDQWMRGTEIKGREMVANLLREMAKLTLIKTVLDPASSGLSNLLGGLLGGGNAGIGAWDTQSFPAMASGGTTQPGVPTLVGERGPEWLIPRDRANVIPNHAIGGMGGGTSVAMHLTIDARGATRDSLPEIERQVSDMQRNLPRIILETVNEGRDRSVL